MVSADLDVRDTTAATGFADVLPDLKQRTTRGGMLYVFSLGAVTPLLRRGWLRLSPRAAGAREPFRVCADPDNLPFSSEDGTGFENRIADLVAVASARGPALLLVAASARVPAQHAERARLRSRDGIAGGVRTGADHACVLPRQYVFVYRGERIERVESLDDPRLRTLRVGVALVGNDLAATPPALALAQRGIVANVTGFAMFAERSIGQRMTDALRDGRHRRRRAVGPAGGLLRAPGRRRS